MSKATDYRICISIVDAYIAKPSKVNPNMMTDDRRKITDDEALALIDWYLDSNLGTEHHVLTFDSAIREGFKVFLTYIEKKDECK